MITILVAIIIISTIMYLIHKKKNISYKKLVVIFLGAVILTFVLWKATVYLNHMIVKKYTIEEITNINFDDIAYVNYHSDNEINVTDFKNEYRNKVLIKEKYIDEKIEKIFIINQVYQSTADLSYMCYDKEGNLLFTMVHNNERYKINNEIYYESYQ